MEASRICDEQAAQSRRRVRRRAQDDLELRAIRAERLVQVGDLSSATPGSGRSSTCPGNQATMRQLTDATRRPPQPREPLPPEVLNHVPPTALNLNEGRSTEISDRQRKGRLQDLQA